MEKEKGREKYEEVTYHRVAARDIHPLDQPTGRRLVQLDQWLPRPVLVEAGDRPDDGSDRLPALDHAGVQLQRLSHPAAQPSSEPDILAGARPGVALERHSTCKISRLHLFSLKSSF